MKLPNRDCIRNIRTSMYYFEKKFNSRYAVNDGDNIFINFVTLFRAIYSFKFINMRKINNYDWIYIVNYFNRFVKFLEKKYESLQMDTILSNCKINKSDFELILLICYAIAGNRENYFKQKENCSTTDQMYQIDEIDTILQLSEPIMSQLNFKKLKNKTKIRIILTKYKHNIKQIVRILKRNINEFGVCDFSTTANIAATANIDHHSQFIKYVINKNTRDGKSYIKWKNLNQFKQCNYCKSNENILKTCKKCENVFYCSKLCQKRDWKIGNHRNHCGIIECVD